MMTLDVIKAVFLGIVEGLTEFIPVSSTGHLLLVGHFLGFDDESFGKSFDVLIQLGAILALLSIYFSRLWTLFLGMFNDPQARRFVIGVLIAFFPAMVLGALSTRNEMLVATPRIRNSVIARRARATAWGQVLALAVTFTSSESKYGSTSAPVATVPPSRRTPAPPADR